MYVVESVISQYNFSYQHFNKHFTTTSILLNIDTFGSAPSIAIKMKKKTISHDKNKLPYELTAIEQRNRST